jgi:hypothetical protein
VRLEPGFKRDMLCLLILAGAVLFLFREPLLTGRTLFLDDVESYFYPMAHFKYQSVRAGVIPLWNPYPFSGMPFLGDPQSAMFYPPGWIFFAIPPETAILLFVVLHFFLSGVTGYYFLRALGLSPPACLCGGAFYAFSGFAVLHAIHLGILAAYSLIPLGLLLTQRLTEKPCARAVALLGLFTGIHILAGAYQMTFFMLLICALLMSGQLKRQRESLKPAGFFILAVLLGILLSAVQLMPTGEFLGLAPRMGAVGFQEAASGSLQAKDLVMLAIPDYFGHPLRGNYRGHWTYWEICLYVGVFPLMLALGALLSAPPGERRRIAIFTGLALFGLLMALGRHTPLYGIFHQLPVFNALRVPGRFMVMGVVSLLYLSGVSCHYLPGLWNRSSPKIHRLLAAAGIILAVALAGMVMIAYDRAGWGPGLAAFVLTGFAGLALIAWGSRDESRNNIFQAGALALILASAFSFGLTWNPTVPGGYYRQWAARFQADKGRTPPARIHYYPPLPLKDSLNLPQCAGVSNIVGYNPLALSRYLEYLIYSDFGRTMEPWIARKLTANGNIFGIDKTGAVMIRLLGVSRDYRHEKMGSGFTFQTRVMPDPFPRAFLAERYVVIPEKESLLKALRAGEMDLRRTLIFQEEPEPGGESPAPSPPPASEGEWPGATVQAFGPNHVRVEISPQRPGWLFLGEIFYPGWEAKVDGKSRKIHRADYIFRAVRVYPGEKSVEFTYSPASLKKGGAVSLAALLAVLALFSCKGQPGTPRREGAPAPENAAPGQTPAPGDDSQKPAAG